MERLKAREDKRKAAQEKKDRGTVPGERNALEDAFLKRFKTNVHGAYTVRSYAPVPLCRLCMCVRSQTVYNNNKNMYSCIQGDNMHNRMESICAPVSFVCMCVCVCVHVCVCARARVCVRVCVARHCVSTL